MGLPNKWTHPEYGVCLSLWAAIDYLTRRGVACAPTSNQTITCTADNAAIPAVNLTVGGWVYPVKQLDAIIAAHGNG